MIKKTITVTIYEDVADLDLPATAAEIALIDAIKTTSLNLGYSETEYLPPEVQTNKELLIADCEVEVVIGANTTITNIGE